MDKDKIERRIKHRIYMRTYAPAYRQRNLEKMREKEAAYRKATSAAQHERWKRWRDKDPVRYAEYCRKDRQRNRRRSQARANERYDTDLNFRIANKLRARFGIALRKNAKSGSAIKLLGCSIKNFRIYIESRFEPEMTWKNTHLDHIIPCALFDLSKPEHQKICFHFSNYRPMFPSPNIRRGGKNDLDAKEHLAKTESGDYWGQLKLFV